jgi:hypothetical protein
VEKPENDEANQNGQEEAGSEFSFSEDGDTKESNGKFEWNRKMAQKFYDTTKTEITTRLINGALEREQANIHSQPMPENVNMEMQADEKMEENEDNQINSSIPIM